MLHCGTSLLLAATAHAVNVGSTWAVITGASSGIGRELARAAAADGFNVLAAARNGDSLKALGTELTEAYGVQVLPMSCDLSTKIGRARLLQASKALAVEVLVANAGIAMIGDATEQAEDRLDALIALNIHASADLCRMFGAAFATAGRGSILVTASITGAAPLPGSAVYGASKAFLTSYTHALRAELAPSGVGVTLLNPGATLTSFAATGGLEAGLAFALPLGLGPILGVVLPADFVAAEGWAALRAGRAEVVPGLMNRAYMSTAYIVPRSIGARFSAAFFDPRANPLSSAPPAAIRPRVAAGSRPFTCSPPPFTPSPPALLRRERTPRRRHAAPAHRRQRGAPALPAALLPCCPAALLPCCPSQAARRSCAPCCPATLLPCCPSQAARRSCAPSRTSSRAWPCCCLAPPRSACSPARGSPPRARSDARSSSSSPSCCSSCYSTCTRRARWCAARRRPSSAPQPHLHARHCAPRGLPTPQAPRSEPPTVSSVDDVRRLRSKRALMRLWLAAEPPAQSAYAGKAFDGELLPLGVVGRMRLSLRHAIATPAAQPPRNRHSAATQPPRNRHATATQLAPVSSFITHRLFGPGAPWLGKLYSPALGSRGLQRGTGANRFAAKPAEFAARSFSATVAPSALDGRPALCNDYCAPCCPAALLPCCPAALLPCCLAALDGRPALCNDSCARRATDARPTRTRRAAATRDWCVARGALPPLATSPVAASPPQGTPRRPTRETPCGAVSSA